MVGSKQQPLRRYEPSSESESGILSFLELIWQHNDIAKKVHDHTINISWRLRTDNENSESENEPSEGSGGTSSSSEDSVGNDKPKVGEVSLTVSKLEAMHSLASLGATEVSNLAKNGMSKKRIRTILSQSVCDCQCTIPEKDLIKLCNYFWRLPKAAQDACLWSIQSESKQRRRQWSLQGPVTGASTCFLHCSKQL